MINRNPPTTKFDRRSYIVNSKLKQSEELQTYNQEPDNKEFNLNPHQFSVKPAIQYNKYINPAVERELPKRYIGQPPQEYVKQFLKADLQDDPFTKYDIEQARLEKLNLQKASIYGLNYIKKIV